MLEFLNKYVTGILVPLMLIPAGIFFAVRLKIFWVRHPIAVLRPLFSGKPRTPGGISPRRALSLALAGTLGVGNIVGVSAAIWLGGAGAIFWMWISAIAASALKYAETVLALRHRKITADGKSVGGTPYYIKDILSCHGLPKMGKTAAFIFAALCLVNSLSMGCVVQMNAVAGALEGVLGVRRTLVGISVAVIGALVCAGGLRRVSAFSSKLVPVMSLGFFVLSAAILILRADAIPGVIRLVISDAFDFDSGKGILGGITGFLISRPLRYGTMRGLITNEAGAGTSPLAHSSADVSSPAEQGFLGIVEVIVDTVILCAMTAAVILVSYDKVSVWGDNSVMMTISAYSAVLGEWCNYAVCAAVLMFGIATVICQSYYGLECLAYLTPGKDPRHTRFAFIPVFSLCALVGALISPGSVWGVADLSMGLMTVINVTVLLLAHREISLETENYFRSHLKTKIK